MSTLVQTHKAASVTEQDTHFGAFVCKHVIVWNKHGTRLVELDIFSEEPIKTDLLHAVDRSGAEVAA